MYTCVLSQDAIVAAYMTLTISFRHIVTGVQNELLASK